MANVLTESQLLSCRRAAARFYRAGGGYRLDEFNDVLHDAYVIGIKEAKKSPSLVGKCFFECIHNRLIDKYRAETGCRYFRKKGRRPLQFVSIDQLEERENSPTRDEFRTNPITKRVVQEWRERNEEKVYRVHCEYGGANITISVTESELETIIIRTLKGTSKWQRQCVLDYYYRNKLMREIGTENGCSESRISQVLSDFKRRLKSAIIHYCGE